MRGHIIIQFLSLKLRGIASADVNLKAGVHDLIQPLTYALHLIWLNEKDLVNALVSLVHGRVHVVRGSLHLLY